MPKNNTDDKQAFINRFNNIANHKHRHEVFQDFVMMSAISLHNAVNMNESLEQEYLKTAGKYNKDELVEISQLLGDLVNLLEPEPRDVLGGLYMDLDLGNANTGQFFTPPEISKLMAELTYGNDLGLDNKPFVTLSEPACGAGGMILAFVNVLIEQKQNPAKKIWVQAIDIDRTACLMCYLQLSLWNVPAQVIVGNTLSLEFREVFYTPAHYLNFWDARLSSSKEEMAAADAKVVPVSEFYQTENIPDSADVDCGDNVQFDFKF